MSAPENNIEQLAADFHELRRMHDDAPARRQPVIKLAMDSARTALEGAFQTPEVEAQLKEQQANLDDDIAFVERLAEKGHLDEGQAVEQLREIMGHEDYALLRLWQGLGATGLSTEVEQVATPAERDVASAIGSGEGENHAEHQLAVQITDDALIINGERFPDTIHGGTKDRKISVLQEISKLKAGEVVKAMHFWPAAIPKSRENRTFYRSLQEWLFTDLTADAEGREFLMLYNGGRGENSEYTRNPNVDLSIEDQRGESVPIPEEPTPASRRETDHRSNEVTLVFKDDVLQVGKGRGHDVPYSSRNQETQRDYGQNRKDALLFILDNIGTKVSPTEIYAHVFGEDGLGNIDSLAMDQVTSWLRRLKFRNYTLVVHNGGRGANSRLTFNPELKPTIVRRDTPLTPDPENNGSAPSRSEGPNADDVPAVPQAEVQADAQALNEQDVFFAANHLRVFLSVLEGNGIDVENLKEDERLNKVGEAIKRDSYTESQEKALAAIETMLADDDALFEFLTLAETDDVRAKFAEFLYVCDEQDIALVKKLLRSSIELDGEKHIVVDVSGEQIWPVVEQSQENPRDEQEEDKVVKDELSARREQRIQDIVETTRHIAERFFEQGLDIDTQYTREFLLSKLAGTGFSQNVLNKAAQRGMCDDDWKSTYSLRKVIDILIGTNNKFAGLLESRTIHTTVEERITAAIAEVKARIEVQRALDDAEAQKRRLP